MNKAIFIKESFKITLFCLSIVLVSILLGANNQTILIAFNMGVMSAAATFVPHRKSITFVTFGSVSVVIAIVLGGALGYYLPKQVDTVGIILAALAFCITKNKLIVNILATSVLMFIIFSFNPFNISDAIHYLLYGILVVILFVVFNLIFDHRIYKTDHQSLCMTFNKRWTNAAIVLMALILGFSAENVLKEYSHLEHLYWIPLTILVIVQGASGKTIKTSLIRIAVNIVGALAVILLYAYILPNIYWLNLGLLVIFLFCIFSLGYSYTLRTFFIEVFVLSFAHFLGRFYDMLSYDRIILTCIGGSAVIISSITVIYLKKYFMQMKSG